MLRLFSTFTGIGCHEEALKNSNIEFKSVGISEVDRYALIAYDAIHNNKCEIKKVSKEIMLKEFKDKNIAYNFSTLKSEMPKKYDDIKKLYDAHIRSKNFGDIRKINEKTMPDFDMFTYSFPCKNISTIGQHAGFSKDSETQSSLLWECERIIQEKMPKYLLMENVKNLVGKENMPNFKTWIDILNKIGYNSYWSVLDSASFGVPQHRERVIMISILKSVDKSTFRMPKNKNKKNKVAIEEILEDNVDDKYFINPLRYNNLILTKNMSKILLYDKEAKYKNISIFDYYKMKNKKFNDLKIDISKYLNYSKKDVKYFTSSITGKNLETLEERVPDEENLQVLIVRKDFKKSGTLTTVQKDCILLIKTEDNKMIARNYTPLECWRLMGLSDSSYYKTLDSGLPISKLYERASRGIVVPMLSEIFENLFYKTDKVYLIGQSDNKRGFFF